MSNIEELEYNPNIGDEDMITVERVGSMEKEMSLMLSKLEDFNTDYQNWLQIINSLEASTNDSILMKRRKRKPLGVLQSHVADFYSNMSLPGVKYMGENGRIDRYVWVFILILSIFVTSKYIEDAYKKWQDSPVLLSYNDSLTHISQLAFPAVTLCPPSQISLNYNLTNSIQHCQQEQDCNTTEWSQLLAARLLCPNAFSDNLSYYLSNPFMSENVNTYFRQVTTHCKDHLHQVTFPDNSNISCNYLLQTIFVEEKVCFTFNMLKAEDLFNKGVIPPILDDTVAPSKPHWTPDWMVDMADLEDTVPRYVETVGESDQLIFVFRNQTDNLRTSCQLSYTDTKIVFHNPAEFPTEQSFTFHQVNHDHNVVAQMTPDLFIAGNQLLKYTPAERRCHFQSELKLSLFRVYTERNCKTECHVNCTLNVCGCIPFYFPRLNENITLCTSLLDRKCLQTKLKGIMKHLWGINSLRGSQQKLNNKIKMDYPKCVCECPAECTYFHYEVEIGEFIQEDQYSLSFNNSRTLRVHFDKTDFESILRKELIGLTDFIANSGGVLGVFTGFSFVALIEFFYYLTLRLWVNVKHSWDNPYEEEELDEELSSCLNTEVYKTSASVQTLPFEI